MSLPRLLFYRDFTEYTGGHGKVWDYFRHARALGCEATVFLTERSLRDERNPWMVDAGWIEPKWQPDRADLLFLGGMDWAALSDPWQPPRPVINLVQHVRHAWVGHPLRQYLAAPAHRICVSQPVADAIADTAEVNGPLTVIPAALDLPELQIPDVPPERRAGVVIAGMKAPQLAGQTAHALQSAGIPVKLLTHWLPRVEYLRRIAEAAVAVTLPHAQEGFYLPALEAMALGTPVVMNDCIGSREYTRDGWNCLLAPPDATALAAAVLRALVPGAAEQLAINGRQTAQTHGQDAERARFARVIHDAWRNMH